MSMVLGAKPTHMHRSVYEKISADSVPEEIKNEILSACGVCKREHPRHDSDTSAISIVFDQFCGSHKKIGAVVRFNPLEIVGHIKNLREFGGILFLSLSFLVFSGDNGLLASNK